MRSRDTLEIEIGLKNIVLRHKQFEERKFALRFLNKIDPNLSCKGRVYISGDDLLKL